jgi:hypothetical protein
MTDPFFKTLVQNRMEELGISRDELVRRLKRKNMAKGHRRLAEIEADNLETIGALTSPLADALNLPVEEVRSLMSRVEESRLAAKREAYRAKFRPHAMYLTERIRPTSWIDAMGFYKTLRVEFPPDLPADQYLPVALRAFPGDLTSYGRVLGLEVRYSPDLFVRYRLDGTPEPDTT